MEIVTGVFQTQEQAENAVSYLHKLDLSDKQIGYITPNGNSPQKAVRVPVTDTEDSGMGQAMGATVGGAMGAAGGATLGLAAASLIVPGVGPVVAFGLLGAVLLGGTGATVGALLGDSLEETLGQGLPHEDIYLYEDALRHGRSIVVAYAEDDIQAAAAREAMNGAGALDIDELRDKWWAEVRDQEFVHYQTNGRDFTRDELSYRRGFEAAHHPACRGKAYAQVQEQLNDRYGDSQLDNAFRSGYDRGITHQTLTESRKD